MQRVDASYPCYIERAYGHRATYESLLVGISQNETAQHEKETHSGIPLSEDVPQKSRSLVWEEVFMAHEYQEGKHETQ